MRQNAAHSMMAAAASVPVGLVDRLVDRYPHPEALAACFPPLRPFVGAR